MGWFDWLWSKRKPQEAPPPAGSVVMENITIGGKTGQKAIVFNDVESMMRMAEEIEQAEKKEEPDEGPKRPLLYVFQHAVLPEAAFQNHPELIRELAGEESPIPLLHFRSKAHVRCMEAGLEDPDRVDDEAAMEEEDALFSAVAIHPHRRGGYTAHVVTMPAPEASPEAHFVAIVHKDDEPREPMRESPSTRYFTLEKAPISDRPMLCEWRRDGSRANYGAGPAAEMAAFVDAVFASVLGDRGAKPVR